MPHKNISAPITLSTLAKTNDLTDVMIDSNANSLPSTESTLMQLRLRISNRPAPLPLRSISPLSSSSSSIFLPSSLGAPAVDLQANSLSLSASNTAMSTIYDSKDLRLSQLVGSSLSLSLPQHRESSQKISPETASFLPSADDVGTNTVAVTTSLPSNSTINLSGQQDQQEGILRTVVRTPSPSLRSLSATSSSRNVSKYASSDDENILVISPICAHFACEPRTTPSMHVSFGQIIRRRVCSLYFTCWKMWHVSRKDRISALQSSIEQRLMAEIGRAHV